MSCSENSPTPSSTAPRKDYVAAITSVPLLIVDDLGMRKLPHTAAEDLLRS